jgi:hypothetical protein
MAEEKFYTIAEAVETFKIPVRTLKRYIKNGKIKSILEKHIRLIPEEELIKVSSLKNRKVSSYSGESANSGEESANSGEERPTPERKANSDRESANSGEKGQLGEESANSDRESANSDRESANSRTKESANSDRESANRQLDRESANSDRESANSDRETDNSDRETDNSDRESPTDNSGGESAKSINSILHWAKEYVCKFGFSVIPVGKDKKPHNRLEGIPDKIPIY